MEQVEHRRESDVYIGTAWSVRRAFQYHDTQSTFCNINGAGQQNPDSLYSFSFFPSLCAPYVLLTSNGKTASSIWLQGLEASKDSELLVFWNINATSDKTQVEYFRC